MKAAKILLRLIVLAGGLIVLSVPRPFVASNSQCGAWGEPALHPCSGVVICRPCDGYYTTFTQVSQEGDSLPEPVLTCQECAPCSYEGEQPEAEPSQCCNPDGTACGTNDQPCCSNFCHTNQTCGECWSGGTPCTYGADCCSGQCYNGQCAATCQNNVNGSCASLPCCSPLLCDSVAYNPPECETCLSNGNTCASSSQCCSGNCSGGKCAPALLGCGSACSGNSQCASGACYNLMCCCLIPPGGHPCSSGSQCCSGNCISTPYGGYCD